MDVSEDGTGYAHRHKERSKRSGPKGLVTYFEPRAELPVDGEPGTSKLVFRVRTAVSTVSSLSPKYWRVANHTEPPYLTSGKGLRSNVGLFWCR